MPVDLVVILDPREHVVPEVHETGIVDWSRWVSRPKGYPEPRIKSI